MNSTITNDLSLSFSEWARKINAQHPDILEYMRKSMDPLDRAIAKQILQAAGAIDP